VVSLNDNDPEPGRVSGIRGSYRISSDWQDPSDLAGLLRASRPATQEAPNDTPSPGFQRTLLYALTFATRTGAQELRFNKASVADVAALEFDFRFAGVKSRYIIAELDLGTVVRAVPGWLSAPPDRADDKPPPLEIARRIEGGVARLRQRTRGDRPADGLLIALRGVPPITPEGLRGALLCGTFEAGQDFREVFVLIDDLAYPLWRHRKRALRFDSFRSRPRPDIAVVPSPA
jgi:hypothetical protein